jgi:hypothetical protein
VHRATASSGIIRHRLTGSGGETTAGAGTVGYTSMGVKARRLTISTRLPASRCSRSGSRRQARQRRGGWPFARLQGPKVEGQSPGPRPPPPAGRDGQDDDVEGRALTRLERLPDHVHRHLLYRAREDGDVRRRDTERAGPFADEGEDGRQVPVGGDQGEPCDLLLRGRLGVQGGSGSGVGSAAHEQFRSLRRSRAGPCSPKCSGSTSVA